MPVLVFRLSAIVLLDDLRCLQKITGNERRFERHCVLLLPGFSCSVMPCLKG